MVRPRSARPVPEYPAQSLRCGEEGQVGVTMCVGPDGAASDVQLTDPSRFPLLNEATLEWARAGKHTPGTVDGVATTFCGVTFRGVFRGQDDYSASLSFPN